MKLIRLCVLAAALSAAPAISQAKNVCFKWADEDPNITVKLYSLKNSSKLGAVLILRGYVVWGGADALPLPISATITGRGNGKVAISMQGDWLFNGGETLFRAASSEADAMTLAGNYRLNYGPNDPGPHQVIAHSCKTLDQRVKALD